jgi:hypothetical protein
LIAPSTLSWTVLFTLESPIGGAKAVPLDIILTPPPPFNVNLVLPVPLEKSNPKPALTIMI